MPLLSVSDLMTNFERHLQEAEEVDIAVAWVRPGPQLAALQNVAIRKASDGQKFSLRIIAGLDGNATHPTALRTLSQFADIIIPHPELCPRGIFHPKIFIFRSKKSVAWIGSANFTNAGFLRNLEAVWEGEGAEDVEAWFSRLWSQLQADSDSIINAYAASWKPPIAFSAATSDAPESGVSSGNHGERHDLGDGRPSDWDGYVRSLHQADRYWQSWAKRYQHGKPLSVLGDGWSWADTISIGGEIARRPDWTGLSDRDRHILLGISEQEGAYGLLGSMRGAGQAKKLFKGGSDADRQTLRRLRSALDPVLYSQETTAVIKAACDALDRMTKEPRIGPAIVTRLLALARPDVCVSVNKGSAPGLRALTGFPKTSDALGSSENYELLLSWIVRQPWHKAAQPADSWQRMLWLMRAALIDCFVYEPL
jgi:HKD family nuclease